MATTEDLFMTEPLLPGETIQRRYQRDYPQAAAKRPQPVDFSVIPDLLALLGGEGAGPEWYEAGIAGDNPTSGLFDQVRRHLHDAANETLPRTVRETHFDIAGANVYSVISEFQSNKRSLWTFLDRFRKAGGV